MAYSGIERYINNFEQNGNNAMRGNDFSQPAALDKGDIMANGWRVNYPFRQSFGVEVSFLYRGGEVRRVFPARIPLELFSGSRGALPYDLQIGDVLETGCVVLDTPSVAKPSDERNYQQDTRLLLTGGRFGHAVQVPSDVHVAVYSHLDKLTNANRESMFGKFIVDRLMDMKASARRKLNGY